jgi:spore maturation protein CgeB
MNQNAFRIVVIGLSLSSSWGNGHATTYRALLRGLRAKGHDVLFLERDLPWYAQNRDLPKPEFCRFALYRGVGDLTKRFSGEIATADAVIIGSYVPDGIEIIDYVLRRAGGVRAFYDIDTPVTLAGLSSGNLSYLDIAQMPEFDLYLSFTGGPLLKHLAQTYGVRRPRALYCSVDDCLHQPASLRKRWDLGYLGTYSADRQPKLERLLIETARRLPKRRFVVAGPQYPADIDWPSNVERIDHIAPHDHAAFYNRQRFTLNITRADMVAAGWSPSVRLFEAAACGTPIISDFWPGLTDFFAANEAILIADATEQVLAALKLSEARRSKIAARARAEVLAQHTGIARASELETYIAQAICSAGDPNSQQADAPKDARGGVAAAPRPRALAV